jgi:hypothetical protein
VHPRTETEPDQPQLIVDTCNRNELRVAPRERPRGPLRRLSYEFGEAIALTVEFGGVLCQFKLGRPALLEQCANEDESLDLKDDAFNLLIHRSSLLLRRAAAAKLRSSMLGLQNLVHESHLSIGH